MARLRYNNSIGALGAAMLIGDTTITFAAAPTWATIQGSDFIALALDPPVGTTPNASFEIVHVTAYTAGQTTATIVRGQEGTSAIAHSNGATWLLGGLALDAGQNVIVFTSSGTFYVPSALANQNIEVSCVGGGGGGGGGGTQVAASTAQAGGGGGGAGVEVVQIVNVGTNGSLTVTIGAGGASGAGGAAGGAAGAQGGGGGSSSVTGTGVSVSAPGGSGGAQSSASSNVAARGGAPLNGVSTNGSGNGNTSGLLQPPGFGGASGVSGVPCAQGGSPDGLAGGGGGGGGSCNTTGLGGTGGAAGTLTMGGDRGAAGGAAALNGTAGANAGANTSAGGGGGGGGAGTTGTGGAGGVGGSGLVVIQW